MARFRGLLRALLTAWHAANLAAGVDSASDDNGLRKAASFIDASGAVDGWHPSGGSRGAQRLIRHGNGHNAKELANIDHEEYVVWPSMLELRRGGDPEGTTRRRGGPRRRRGVTSIIGDYNFDGNIGAAKTGIWRPAFAAGIDKTAIHLNNPSPGTIDVEKAERRYESNNSFLQFPRVSKRVGSFALMFDFKFIRRNGQMMVTDGADLLQFVTADNPGSPFETHSLGFGVSANGDVLKFAGQAMARNITNKWIHVGLSSRFPCHPNRSTLKIFIDGKLRTNITETKQLMDICGKTPLINFNCWDHGQQCSAQLEMMLDNMWTIEDYISLSSPVKLLKKVEDDGSEVEPPEEKDDAIVGTLTRWSLLFPVLVVLVQHSFTERTNL
eukprot:TRINITY_DN11190_c0_g4_i1.p1 TRINITY_DN11190_c0_g4~~TRINITY_DN11190_c0_g4_i1.p1  ORF type:complete len:424 (-),score=56.81 TRINITY_DN11190_c0_g4_i1:19-1170(-)